MGQKRTLYAIAESCPFDAALVRDMRRAVNSLLQLNLKRFRLPQKTMTKYSALDVMKQALELMFEFSPSEKNYREAMRTITVYSEGDEEMRQVLRDAFKLIANAVYNAYAGQRKTEQVAPEVLFLQGVPFEQSELQQSFRYVGVKPPDVTPASVKQTIFLDEGSEAYRSFLEGRISRDALESGREERWVHAIRDALSRTSGTSLMRVGAEHVIGAQSVGSKILARLRSSKAGRLPSLLRQNGVLIEVVESVPDVNGVFGR